MDAEDDGAPRFVRGFEVLPWASDPMLIEQVVDWSDPRLPARHWINLEFTIISGTGDGPAGAMAVNTSNLLQDPDGDWSGPGVPWKMPMTDSAGTYSRPGASRKACMRCCGGAPEKTRTVRGIFHTRATSSRATCCRSQCHLAWFRPTGSRHSHSRPNRPAMNRSAAFVQVARLVSGCHNAAQPTDAPAGCPGIAIGGMKGT
jgi:hypothetical protein